MPTLTMPNGTIVTFTVDEFIEYQARSTQKPLKPLKIRDPRGTITVREDPWEAFLYEISPKAKHRMRRVLALVKGRSTQGYTIQELCKAMNDFRKDTKVLDPNITSGTTAGIGKNIRKCGLNEPDVMFKDPADNKYKAGPLLLKNEIPDP